MASVSRAIAALPARLLPPGRVGAGLRRGAAVRAGAVLVAAVVLALDWTFVDRTGLLRALVGLAGLAALALLARERAATLGLLVRPAPSWAFWARAAAALAALAVLGGVLFFAFVSTTGLRLPVALQVRSLEGVPRAAWRMCVLFPAVEELVYRGVLVPALVPVLRPWGAVLASGLAFAWLHHLYGNAGPDNQVAGFVLAWAYLRSGALWVPFALHAGGNAMVLVLHLGVGEGWWTLPGIG